MFEPELPYNRCSQPTAYSQPAPAHLRGQISATYTFSSHPLYHQRVLRRPHQLQQAGENDLVYEPVDIMSSEGLAYGPTSGGRAIRANCVRTQGP